MLCVNVQRDSHTSTAYYIFLLKYLYLAKSNKLILISCALHLKLSKPNHQSKSMQWVLFQKVTSQSEMADTRSLWRTCDTIMHVFIITHVLCNGVLWWHIFSYIPMVKNPLIISGVRIPIILEEDRPTGIILRVQINHVNPRNSFWVTPVDRQQTNQHAIPCLSTHLDEQE